MWERTKSQELLSLFKNHCLDNSAYYATNIFTFILGNLASDAKEENIISMVIKSYIYRKRCLNKTLTIQGLLSDIRTHLTTVKYIDTKKVNLKILTENCRNGYFFQSYKVVKHVEFLLCFIFLILPFLKILLVFNTFNRNPRQEHLPHLSLCF